MSASVSCEGVLGGTKNVASGFNKIRSDVQCSRCQRQHTRHSGGGSKISLLLIKIIVRVLEAPNRGNRIKTINPASTAFGRGWNMSRRDLENV